MYPVGGRVLTSAPAYARASIASAVTTLTSTPAAELTSGEASTPGPASKGLGQLTET